MSTARIVAPNALPFSSATREERFAAVDAKRFDLAVVGAGITGAAIARDAALRGLRTLLIDRGDVAGGTSSQSSKLVHGGLRYLPQGRLGLVLESVGERKRLRGLAPHLVRPQRFVFPVFERRPKPLYQVAFGLMLYDALALFRGYSRHRTLNAAATSALEPCLRSDGLNGSVTFHDCVTDDARLTLEISRAAHLAGAHVLTYCRAVGLPANRGLVDGVEIEDTFTGRCRTATASVVVLATGPWTDRARGLRGDRRRLLRPTKGIHILVHRDRLPIVNAVATSDLVDGRSLFAIPMGNRVALGTTDTDYAGDFDNVQADRGDVEALLSLASYAFPSANLGTDDVLSTWAGLRPLLTSDGEPTEVSREHAVVEDEDGLITIAGGKLTTHRLMASDVLEHVGRRLREEGVHVGGCVTGSIVLPGGRGVTLANGKLRTTGPEGHTIDVEAEERLGADVVEHLRQSHGGRWLDIARRTVEDPRCGRRIVSDLPYIWADVDVAVEEECALRIDDVLRRRTQIQLKDRGQGLDVADAVARRMGDLLGWDELRIHQELTEYGRLVAASRAWDDTRT